VNAETTIRIQ